MVNARYVIEVSVPGDKVSIPFQSQPEKRAICMLLASGLFQSLSLIDTIKGETPFFISGPTISEYGKMWLEKNRD